MDDLNLERLKYPIGHFHSPAEYTNEIVQNWIKDIEQLPLLLKEAVIHLSDKQLDTTYRPGGWTIRQVVHHLSDSHMNSLCRFKLALTEDNPTIRPYFEDRWAEIADSTIAPVDCSLKLLEGLHHKWVILLKSMKSSDFERTFFHPESKKTISIKDNIGTYSWHGKHHLAQINSLKERSKW